MKIYPIDFEIVKSLYNLQSKEEALIALDTFSNVHGELIRDEISKYLSEIGRTQDDITNILEDVFTQDQGNVTNPKHKEMLSNPILEKRIGDRIEGFNKSIYDTQIPLLSEEAKASFDEYLGVLKQKFDLEKEATLMVFDYVNRINESRKQIITNSTQMKSIPTINLGGNMSNPRISTNVAQSQSQPSDAQITSQAKQTTIDTKPVSHNPEPQSVTTPVATQTVPPVAPIQVTPLQASEGDVLNV